MNENLVCLFRGVRRRRLRRHVVMPLVLLLVVRVREDAMVVVRSSREDVRRVVPGPVVVDVAGPRRGATWMSALPLVPVVVVDLGLVLVPATGLF